MESGLEEQADGRGGWRLGLGVHKSVKSFSWERDMTESFDSTIINSH